MGPASNPGSRKPVFVLMPLTEIKGMSAFDLNEAALNFDGHVCL